MDSVTLVGLLRLSLPGRTVRLCDGGFVHWGDETFQGEDDDFGTIGAFEALTEGVGDEAPSGTLTFYPRDIAAAVALSRPGYQGSRVELFVAEIDEATGLLAGEPESVADWMTDRTVLKRTTNGRALEVVCVTGGQRLMLRNRGNTLSTPAHQRVWPGERGHDNAVGLEAQVAWGVSSPPRGVISSGGRGTVGGAIYGAAYA